MELVATFSQPVVLNRVKIELDNYQGLTVARLSSSPDGIVEDNLLEGALAEFRSADGSSNKFSGDWVYDFDPRHVKQLRLVLAEVMNGSACAASPSGPAAIKARAPSRPNPSSSPISAWSTAVSTKAYTD